MRRIPVVLVVILALISSGCLTITEKYSFRKDGSGSMEYIIDMSEIHELLSVLNDSTGTESLNIENTFRELVPELGILKGISNVQINGDAKSYIYGVSFDFENIESLNSALAYLFEDDKASQTKFIEKRNRKYTRLHGTSEDFSREALLGDDKELDEEMMKDILSEMNYEISMEFEREIKKIKSNADYSREDEKSVLIYANFNQMLDDEDFLQTMVKTKRK